MKKFFCRIIKFSTLPLISILCSVFKKCTSFMYYLLFRIEWCIDSPENFNHEIDLYYYWDKACIPHWLERGIYNIQALKMFKEPIVLELCCGDRFNTKHFYSTSAKYVYSVDFDNDAIEVAKKKNQMPNIIYKVQDIRENFRDFFSYDGAVTNIIWDAAIEHFTEIEIDTLMKSIKSTLAKTNGIVSGFTIVERSEGKSLEQHEYEFKSMNDLKRFFMPYFKNVYVFETIYNDRHNLYFYASDGELPFSNNWYHSA